MSDRDTPKQRAAEIERQMWEAADAVYLPPPTTQAAIDILADLSVGDIPDTSTREGMDYFVRGLSLVEQQARAGSPDPGAES